MKVNKYRKKPVVIEAIQYTDINFPDLVDFVGPGMARPHNNPMSDDIFIKTLEGEMMCKENDWIIKGIKGEFYPCKPDIFEATYEAIK